MSCEWGRQSIFFYVEILGRSAGLYARENVSNRPSLNVSVRRVRDRRQAKGADRIYRDILRVAVAGNVYGVSVGCVNI